MKQILIQSLFILVSLNPIKSQGQLLLEEDKHWIFLTHQENDTGVNILSGFFVNIQGDTLIGSITYKKLYSYNLKGEHNCQFPPCFTPNIPYEIENKSLYALMREDSQGNVVYHYNPSNSNCSEEYELFNFQQNVGDTIHNCVRDRIAIEDDDGIIDSISTINIYNKERKVLSTKGDAVFEGLQFSAQLKIIQGIGFEQYGFFGGTQDELIDICFGSLNDCNVISSISKALPKPRVKLYPNPVYDQLNLVSEKRMERVSILDMNGSTLFIGDSENINIEFLNSGIYHLTILLEDGKLITILFAKIY